MSGNQMILLGGSQAPAVDPYFYSVTSLLHGDGTNGGQNNTFLDSSSNNFTITRNGNTTQGSFSPFSQTGWSNYFDGTGDYLTAPSNAAFQFGTGDFTIECWSYVTGGNNQLFYDFRSSFGSNNGFNFGRSNADGFYLYNNVEGVIISSGAGTAATNTYVHVAVSRSGSTLRLFINGILVKTATNSTNYNSTAVPTIGGSSTTLGTPGDLYTGYISNLRVVKGTAVYTADFTVPTTPLTAISGTSLLTCQANRFLDASSNAFAITRAGDVSVQPFSPFNPTTAYSTSTVGGSGYFDGSGDYLTTPTNTAFSFGTGDFTISTWVYTGDDSLSPLGYSRSVFTLGDIIGYLRINAYHGGTTGAFRAFVNGVHICDGSTVKLSDRAWHNITIVRESGNVRHWIDGIYVGTVAYSTSITNTITNGIGADMRGPDGNWNGYISGMYVNKGTALFTGTSNISVPTAPPTTSSGNSFLLNFTNGAIFDNAAVADYETVGNAQISTSVKKYGTGSLAFDGSGDYLVTDAPSTDLFAFGSGNFTIEFWVYFNSVSGFPVPYDGRASGANSTTPTIYLASGTIRYYVSAADRITGPALSASTWYHVAICRVASQTKMFINGTQVGSTYADTTVYTNTVNRPTIGGDGNAPGSNGLNGYIDDLRISKGVARYPYNFTPPTAEFPNIGGTVTLTADPYFDYTTLLLPGNGTNGAQNNTFLDSSTNAFSITRNGNTTQGTFSPFSQTGWGNYFDGSGDYLSVPNNAVLAYGTGDFTVEFWINRTGAVTSLDCGVIDQRNGVNGAYFMCGVDPNQQFFVYLNSAYRVGPSAATTLALGAWYHIAYVRSGTTGTLYINGTSVGSWSDNLNYATNTVLIGRHANGGGDFPGYLSNIRILKGTAQYTANFTPPTAPLTAITNTSLLTCQSNRFIDNSTNALTITPNGGVSVQTFSPFNPTAAWSAATYGGSGYFDGSGDSLTLASNAAFAPGTGDFTVEAWIYPTAAWGTWDGVFVVDVSGGIFFGKLDTGFGLRAFAVANIVSTTAPDINTWTHVAVSRSGTTVRLFINGALAASATSSQNFGQGTAYIGNSPSAGEDFSGYISGLRLIKGTAVYTSAFTPPTAPLTAITNTSLLCNFTNAGIYDATSKNDLETVGNAQISTTQSKFGGSSMYFDGNGDYLFSPANEMYAFRTGDFTVEFWVYFNALASNQTVAGTASAYRSGGWQLIQLNAANTLTFLIESNPWNQVNTGVLSTGQWYHIAVTRYSGTLRMFVNGFVTESVSSSESISDSTGNKLVIGNTVELGAGRYLNGYIDDFRITKGIARYTSNFTPPTTAFLTL